MKVIEILIYLSGVWPLWRAWRSNRRTTLRYPLAWSAAAWLAWAALIVLDQADPATRATARYLALCLTSCAGIAVLGARWPIAGPWNLVLLGLLAVLLLPWAENVLLGTPLLDPLRLGFVIATLAVGVLNYLPTRLAGMVLVLALACAAELMSLLDTAVEDGPLSWLAHISRVFFLPLACWLGLAQAGRSGARSEFDRHWLAFRDRFGLLWGLRFRDQFNRAAANAGWPVWLQWNGLVGDAPQTREMVEMLCALLRPFGARSRGEPL